MKIKLKILIILIVNVILCSCELQNDNDGTEDLNTSLAVSSVTSATEVTAVIDESNHSNESVSDSETEPPKTEITTSSEGITSQTEAVTSLTETEPVYDKATPPVLTVSNIDYKTNDMSWTAVEGAQTYMLYILNEQTGEFEEYGEIKGTSCKDINLIPNTKYTYSVAAKFNDGSFGKMSEAADIYTYSLYASNVQGDWVYAYEYNDEKEKAKIYRTKTDGSISEDITDYSFEWVKDICVNGRYVFFIEGGYYSGRIIRVDIADKKAEVIKEYVPHNWLGWYEISKMAVYNNNIFYVTYGFWSETDEPYYNLHTIDFSGNDTKIKANYHETYSPIYFLNTENILYIVWRDEEIKEVKTDDNYFLAGVYTDKCYVYDAAVQQIITVKVPQETYDERYIFLKYDDGFLYIEIEDNGYIIKANSDGYEYISENNTAG